ncbi:nickel transport complex, NikM subunit,transmembrane [Emticicia sp. BO119]|uniref:nickel transport complex, NikM subunit,transmembrane n=1 Tax=Emticicia sp. BO119 TaxID=2757768 RepID=UPI0015F02F3D|nr:nickel transport complex, NikM subunit,transmembrane [Emticicia sp. BO119]MBA4853498.1 nickel transport complex, NikM subunit,transmembrane [Emticicia sp. BO119]
MKNKIIIFALLLIPFLSEAHGYWLEVKGSGKVGEPVKIQIFYGEFVNQGRMKGKFLDKMNEIKLFVIDEAGDRINVPTFQTETHWEGSFTPKTEGNYQIMGINETREVQDWAKHNLGIVRPMQYLRTNYVVGKFTAVTKPNNFLDIIATESDNGINLNAFKNNFPVDKAKLTIISPDGWEKVRITSERGRASFIPNTKGIYLIEAEWIDKTPGTYKEKEYESIRYHSETTIEVR